MLYDLKLIWFLVTNDKTYGQILWKEIAILGLFLLATWTVDPAVLTSTGTMPPELKLQLRTVASIIEVFLWLLAFTLLTRPYFKKWKDVRHLSYNDLSRLNRYYHLSTDITPINLDKYKNKE